MSLKELSLSSVVACKNQNTKDAGWGPYILQPIEHTWNIYIRVEIDIDQIHPFFYPHPKQKDKKNNIDQISLGYFSMHQPSKCVCPKEHIRRADIDYDVIL